jgi:hypothetical protein
LYIKKKGMMSMNNPITMHYGAAWSNRTTREVSDVPNTSEFKVEVKNTWSKEMRLDSLTLHVLALKNSESITLNLFNDKDELVCSPHVATNSYGNPTVVSDSNMNRPNMARTGTLRMERDIIIPAGGTCLLRVTMTDPVMKEPVVRAELWKDYLAYTANMSVIAVDMIELIGKELAILQNKVQILSMRTEAKENELEQLQMKSKENTDLIQKLVQCELNILSKGATARADLLLQAMYSMC